MNDSSEPDLQLISVKLKNILSFKEAEFKDINQFAVLVGKNNSGKSNLFKALMKCKNNTYVDNDFFYTGSDPSEAEIILQLKISEKFFINILNEKKQVKNYLKSVEIPPFFSILLYKIKFVELLGEQHLSKIRFIGWKGKKDDGRPFSTPLVNDQEDRLFNVKVLLDPNNIITDIKTKGAFESPVRDLKSNKELYSKYSQGPPHSMAFYGAVLDFIHKMRFVSEFRSFQEKLRTNSGQKIDQNGSNFPNAIYEFINNFPEKIEKLNKLLKIFYPDIKKLGGKVRKFITPEENEENSLELDYAIPFIIEEGEGKNRTFDYVGSGLHQITVILCHLLELEHDSILLIEEPELFIHPKLQKILLKILFQFLPRQQIMISTHSQFFLKNLHDKGSIHHIEKLNGYSKIKNSSSNDLMDVFVDLGIHPADFLLYDRLVFVEGESDENAINEWIKILKLDENQMNLGFIRLGGVKNYTHFAASATLKFLQDKGIQMWFIIDHDERDESDIDKLRQKIKGFDKVDLKVLEKRELENYFLIPRVIFEFINKKIQSLNLDQSKLPKLDIETVTKELNFQVMEQRNFTLEKKVFYKLSKPGYINDKKIFPKSTEESIQERLNPEFDRLISFFKEQKERIETVYEEEENELNNLWKSDKLSLVPGSKILKEIAKAYGVTYNKAKDAGFIASLLTEDEIDIEIRELLSEILED